MWMHECVRDSEISDWLARKLMGNIQVTGALKMVITKVSMVAEKCQLVVTIKKGNRALWKSNSKILNFILPFHFGC
jgi:hypothetical protein